MKESKLERVERLLCEDLDRKLEAGIWVPRQSSVGVGVDRGRLVPNDDGLGACVLGGFIIGRKEPRSTDGIDLLRSELDITHSEAWGIVCGFDDANWTQHDHDYRDLGGRLRERYL